MSNKNSVFDRIGDNSQKRVSPPPKKQQTQVQFSNFSKSLENDNNSENEQIPLHNPIPTFFRNKYSNISDDDWHELDDLFTQHNVKSVSALKKQLKLLKRRQKGLGKQENQEAEKKCETYRKKAEQLEAQLVANSADAAEVKWENHHLKQRLANQPEIKEGTSDEMKTILAAKDTIYEEV